MTVASLKKMHKAAVLANAKAQDLAAERNRLLYEMVTDGGSQADLARELQVSRQRLGKMVARGKEYAA